MTKTPNIKKTRISVFQDTSKNLEKVNPLLISGEWGMETDTGKLKIGDGKNLWNALPYKIDQTLTKEMVNIIYDLKASIEKRGEI